MFRRSLVRPQITPMMHSRVAPPMEPNVKAHSPYGRFSHGMMATRK